MSVMSLFDGLTESDAGRKVYVFSPDEGAPYGLIHPLKRNGIRLALSRPIPGYVVAILLFGSATNLFCTSRSDTDLFVIVRDEIIDDRALYRACLVELNALFGDSGDYDLLIESLPEYLFAKDDPYSVEHRIWKEGIVLYAQKSHLAAKGTNRPKTRAARA